MPKNVKITSDLELGRQKNIIAKELANEIVKGSEAGVLYYISGKTKIKIKEHFAETKVTALDLVESAIKYEKRTEMAG